MKDERIGNGYYWHSEAAIQKRSWEKVFWKYAANLQESTYTEVRFQ